MWTGRVVPAPDQRAPLSFTATAIVLLLLVRLPGHRRTCVSHDEFAVSKRRTPKGVEIDVDRCGEMPTRPSFLNHALAKKKRQQQLCQQEK